MISLRKILILLFTTGIMQLLAQSYRTPIIEYTSVVENINNDWKLRPETSTWGRDVDLPMFYAWYSEGFPNSDGKYWKFFPGAKEAFYEKVFDVPSSMVGKRIFVRFEAVNYLCQVYINGNYVGGHDGGYVPFEIDITDYVIVPSHNNKIKVNIEADNSRLFKGATTDYLQTNWPQGWYGARYSLGIYEDVHLVARPQVYIADTFIKTSHRDQKITALVSIANASDVEKVYDLTACVMDDGSQVIDFGTQSLTIPPEDTLDVTLKSSWGNPRYWMPGDPYFYYFHSYLKNNGSEIFHRSDRFGFREFYIDGDKFALNGIRYNLLGDKIVAHSEKPFYEYYYPEPESWATIVDSLLGLNINNISFHQEPPRSWMLDICDEKGMSVINESALYASFFVKSDYCYSNMEKWTEEWVKRDRNHPSVIMWNVSNEAKKMGGYPKNELLQVGQKVDESDGTRPYVFAGDYSLYGTAMIHSVFYIFGHPNAWSNVFFNHYTKIEWWYSISNQPEPDFSKPVSYGEFELYRSADEDKPTIERWNRLQNIQIRHARILGIPEIKPYRLDWAWHPSRAFFTIYDGWQPKTADIQMIKNSLNPMAVFDKNYYKYNYNYYYAPEVETYDEGDTFDMIIVAFNDEFEGETVEIKWRTLVDDQERTSGISTETIPLGGSIEKEITITVPNVLESQNFDLELCAYKDGVLKFSERYPYYVKNTGNSNSKPATVTGLSANISGKVMLLNWNPVTRDIYGNNMAVDSYTLFYSPDVSFNTSVDSITGVTSIYYNHSIPSVIGKAGEYLYYKVQAVNYEGLRSDISDEYVGVCNYPLYITDKTNLNTVAFPYPVSGLNSSQDILDLVPNATSVVNWDESMQGFYQYVPEIPPTSFDVSSGQAYYIDVDASSVYSIAGRPLDLQFNLYSHGSDNTSWNDIIIPLDYTDIENASDLYQNIQNCNGLARWIAHSESGDQYYEQYHPESGLNNFDIYPGMVYKVHVNQNTGWPNPVFSKSNQIKKNALSIGRRFSPHLVVGRFDEIGLENTDIHGTAYFSHDVKNYIETSTPEFFLQDNYWGIQCASFQSGWQVDDTLIVQFYDNHNTSLGNPIAVSLTLMPTDYFGTTGIFLPQNVPNQFKLLQNYPNPFNSETRITYCVAEMSHIKIDIFNVKGQKIFNLENSLKNPGTYFINWHGKDRWGHDVGSGIYIVQFTANNYVSQQRILLIR